jgi:glycosyltransferase involved in cell wall biosynthesis
METEDSSERLAKLEQRVAVIERNARRLRAQYEREVVVRKETFADKLRPKIGRFDHYRPRLLRHPEGYEASANEFSPTIVIVTPSFNQHQFIKATIDSVLAQNYPALRYHVQDAASTDGTVALLKTYDGKLSWSSVSDHGQAHGLNVGFRSFGGDGDIMAYLNSDDVLMPGALTYVAKAFADNPGVDVVYGHRICIDEDGMEIGRWILPQHDPVAIKWFDFIPQETMFWRRRVWQEVGEFDESFRYALDWDFILRAHSKGMKFKRLPRFLACFRVHDAQKSTDIFDVGQRESGQLRKIHVGFDPDAKAITRAIAPYLRRHVLYHRLYKLKILRY